MNKGEAHRGKKTGSARQARLKLALRENLKRRKSQARGRDDRTAASSDQVDRSLDDDNANKP